MLNGYPSRAKAVIITAVVVLLFLAVHVLYSKPELPKWSIVQGEAVVDGQSGPSTTPAEPSDAPPCRRLPGAEDVVVIMRTGATEIQDKLPIHFNTTFRCYKDLIIFSDYEETFQGHPVHDVLGPMAQEIKETNADFGLYLRLLQYGRASLHEDELSGKASFEGSKSGKNDNPGWRLDKWKFLPMMNETLRLQPDKKWYVFVESDSYAVWSNILQWLEKLDPSKPLYYGSEVMIGPDLFAHGGSVFVMSRPAVESGAQYYKEHEEELNSWTAGHWAGDCVLGKTLRDAGVPLTYSWPMFQGGHPDKMDFTDQKGSDRRLWCAPALSYHHFSPTEMPAMWQFEQDWIQSHLVKVANSETRRSFWDDYGSVLEHRDVFKEFVRPDIVADKSEWSNLSPSLVPNTVGSSFDECREQCELHEDCLQYTSAGNGCFISTKQVMLGERTAGTESGWMMDRIEGWVNGLDDCSGNQGWTVT